jgi:D-alanine-D-alanine ligase-like ATP-grasp enzyme
MLNTYKTSLQEMENADGKETKDMSRSLGTFNQAVALYNARKDELHNSSGTLQEMLKAYGVTVTHAMKDARLLNQIMYHMHLKANAKDLEEAERLMPVQLGSQRAVHKCQHCAHQKKGWIFTETKEKRIPGDNSAASSALPSGLLLGAASALGLVRYALQG